MAKTGPQACSGSSDGEGDGDGLCAAGDGDGLGDGPAGTGLSTVTDGEGLGTEVEGVLFCDVPVEEPDVFWLDPEDEELCEEPDVELEVLCDAPVFDPVLLPLDVCCCVPLWTLPVPCVDCKVLSVPVVGLSVAEGDAAGSFCPGFSQFTWVSTSSARAGTAFSAGFAAPPAVCPGGSAVLLLVRRKSTPSRSSTKNTSTAILIVFCFISCPYTPSDKVTRTPVTVPSSFEEIIKRMKLFPLPIT